MRTPDQLTPANSRRVLPIVTPHHRLRTESVTGAPPSERSAAWASPPVRCALLARQPPPLRSKVENGLSSLDERRTLHVVADALRVPVTKLTGQPFDPATRAEQTVRAAVADIRDVLYGVDVGESYAEAARSLAVLSVEVERAAELRGESALDRCGPLLPPLLMDLYAHAADGRGQTRARVLPLLLDALNTTRDVAHWAGEPELAYRASEQAVTAATLAGDPSLLGFARFGLIHSLAHVDGQHARARAGVLAERGAEELQPHAEAGPAAEMYGMLHLTAAWSRVLAGARATAEMHLQEAAETASRTGAGGAYRLCFGPTNVAAWRVSLAVEGGEDGGRVRELAAQVSSSVLPLRERRAGHWINVGRGLAADPATAPEAVEAFRRARRLTPMRTRLNPFVRAAGERLLYEVGGPEVRQFAVWLGIVPAEPNRRPFPMNTRAVPRSAVPPCGPPRVVDFDAQVVCSHCGAVVRARCDGRRNAASRTLATERDEPGTATEAMLCNAAKCLA